MNTLQEAAAVRNPSIMVGLLPFVLALVSGLVGASAIASESDRSTAYTYYPSTATAGRAGKLKTIDGPRVDVPDIATLDYDASGRLASETNALGHVTTWSNFNGDGRAQTQVDANGVTTTFSFDARDRLTSVLVKDPAGNATLDALTQIAYTATGKVERVTLADGTWLVYGYDDAERLVSITNAAGEQILYTLDAAGNVTKEQYKSAGGTVSFERSSTYDELSRNLKELGAVSSVPNRPELTHSYDTEGNLQSSTDASSRVTTRELDALGRVTTLSQSLSGAVTDLTYDSRGNLLRVEDPRDLKTSYTYTAFDDLKTVNSPDTGLTTFVRDEAGNVLSRTDAAGNVASMSYDALNRVTSAVFTPPVGSTTPPVQLAYSYDDPTPGRYGIGRLTKVTDDNGSVELWYDPRGNVVRQTSTIGSSAAYETVYRYDLADRLVEITYPGGRIVNYARHPQTGRVTEVTTRKNAAALEEIVASDITYAPFGGPSGWIFGNGQVVTVTRDQNYRITGIHASMGTTALGMEPAWDKVNNLIALDDTQAPANSQIFEYDALDRLENAVGGYGEYGYTYDLNGNLLSRSLQGGTTKVFDYSGTSNRITAQSTEGVTYTHDANGHRATRSAGGVTTTYRFDARQRLVALEQTGTAGPAATYAYNAFGQRVSKWYALTGSTTHFLYGPGGVLLAEKNAASNTRTEYIPLDGQPLAVVTTIENPPAVPVIRNNDDGTGTNGLTGTWTQQSNATALNGDYLLASSTSQAATYRWSAMLPASGVYRVYARWVALAGNDTAAPYTIRHAGGQSPPVTKDQTRNGGGWVLLGEYLFNAEVAAEVEVAHGPASGQTVADAVRFSQVTDLAIDSYAVHTDHIGTPVRLSDRNGAIAWSWDRLPYGTGAPSGSVDFNLRFPGQYEDPEMALAQLPVHYYNYFRDYDPSTGRYIESDPIGLAGGLNTYAYVGGNPLRFTDPTGEVALNPATGAAGGGVVGGPVGAAVGAAIGTVALGVAAYQGYKALSTVAPDPNAAGEEAASEIKAEPGYCPVPPDGPDNDGDCDEKIRHCTTKCLRKLAESRARISSEWIGRCVLACTSSLGCSNVGGGFFK